MVAAEAVAAAAAVVVGAAAAVAVADVVARDRKYTCSLSFARFQFLTMAALERAGVEAVPAPTVIPVRARDLALGEAQTGGAVPTVEPAPAAARHLLQGGGFGFLRLIACGLFVRNSY